MFHLILTTDSAPNDINLFVFVNDDTQNYLRDVKWQYKAHGIFKG